jgi:hypothetical protein
MNDTLSDYLRKFVLVFFDDILIYSTSYTEHLHHITLVLQRLQDHHWQVKMYKYEFAQQSIAYLGHIIYVVGLLLINLKSIQYETGQYLPMSKNSEAAWVSQDITP